MKDNMVRATAANAQIRAFACTTKETVETARAAHNTSPVVTAALGRLLSAGAMMGSMLKGEDELITLQIKGDGPVGGLTVTADGNGHVKGYANVPDVILPANAQGKLDVGGAVGNGVLSVIRDMGLKDPYVGQTELQTGDSAEYLTYYFAVSEQVPSVVGLVVLMIRDNTVRQAGGFIVQLMPFAEEETISRLEENIKNLSSVTAMLDAGKTPEGMLEVLLSGMNPEITDTLPVEFACNCSKDRVRKALISIGREELQSMIDDAKPIEVNCHFCNKNYTFDVDELKDILSSYGFDTDVIHTKSYGNSVDFDWDYYGSRAGSSDFMSMYSGNKQNILGGEFDVRKNFWSDAGVDKIPGMTRHELYNVQGGNVTIYQVPTDIHAKLSHNGGTFVVQGIWEKLGTGTLFMEERQVVRRLFASDTLSSIFSNGANQFYQWAH